MTYPNADNWRKPRRSYGTGDCLEAANWRKPLRSMSNGNCLLAGNITGLVLVRDTKDRDGAMLVYPAGAWQAFLADVKRGAI